MISRSERLNNSRLYVILDAQVADYNELFRVVENCVSCGVDIVQLRDKTGETGNVLNFSKDIVKYLKKKILFIVNDSVKIALESGADGVHLGQSDGSVADARKEIGKNFLIGRSCQTLEQAMIAQDEGADYIGFGSVFKTLTKPERIPMDLSLLETVLRKIRIPVFPIGGIDLENIEQVISRGAGRVAVCRALCESARFARDAREFHEKLMRSSLKN